MLIPLTDTELDQVCAYLANTPYIYYPEAVDFASDLYYTGCRPNEVLNTSLWTITTPTEVELQPLKGNSTRTIDSTLLSDSLIQAIANAADPYTGLSLRQLEWVLKKVLPVPILQTDDKSAIAYIFRYNYVKNLHNAGASDATIAALMGWSDTALSSRYYSRIIYSDTPLPPLETFYITDANSDRITDGNGDRLIFQ